VLFSRTRFAAAGAMAAVAFSFYLATLLPGQDLGDTASFQTIAGDHLLVPRQGYPLYFALNGLLVHLLPVEPARAVNLGSAIAAALAVGLVVLIGAELGGTLVAGLVAGLLLAGSYTFWSQAIIAEVYALHLLVASACLLALLAWQRRPTLPRLALFFSIYALGFGNHLSMILLLPGFALFLLMAAPGGPMSMLRPRVVGLALGLAALFALQYVWNFTWLVFEYPDASWTQWLRTFWFDVTKADWRANMVYGIPWSTLPDRFAMYWFDLRQQVGVPGSLAAVAGVTWLLWRRRRLGILLLVLWLVNWGFAFTYNVGDTHVFYLPSHWVVALAAGCGAAWIVWGLRTAGYRTAVWAVSAVLLLYPAWRAYDTFPAMDRSDDVEPSRFFERLTADMDGGREILGSDMNWQLHNGFDYYAKYTRPDLVVFNLPDTLLYFPAVVSRNAELGRTVLLTEGSAAMVRQLYGSLYDLRQDPRVPVPPLADRISALAPGTRYVLTVIDPYPETPIDQADLIEAARRLGIARGNLPRGRFVVVAGRVGEPPVLRQAAADPFRVRVSASGQDVDIRFECWLPADTIRRAGFGHIIVNRLHQLTLDRGVSFVALDDDGRATLRAWAGGLFAPQPRFIVRTAPAN
jgi:Protein O-mannosyl-transferase TMEM260-like